MTIRKPSALNIALVGIAVAATAVAVAQQPSKDAKPGAGAPPAMQLPPGWTPEDAKACELSMTPGKMHEWLQKGVGTWSGKNTMWMFPGAPGEKSDSTTTVTSLMDGRYIQVDSKGDMGDMGPFHGLGFFGYDNVSQKFQGAWIDNCGTAVAPATGQVSADGKTMTWTYSYTCPITKKPTTMRQVDKIISENEKMMEMYAFDPKSGKEFKMLEMQMTRKH